MFGPINRTRTAGNGRAPGRFDEIGTPGLDVFSGFITKAYITELQWPLCFPIYNRIRRSDPEVSIVRTLFQTLAASLAPRWRIPPDIDKPTDDDKRAVDFGDSILSDFPIYDFRDELVSYVPFLGWGWWSIVPGRRSKDWRPPDREDDWRSQYDDGLIGLRRLGFRDHSSFSKWDINERTGKLRGMYQLDTPNPEIRIPRESSIHLTFGDPTNPEGLATLEAIYRLERYKYSLEVVQGMGFEHAAGHFYVEKKEQGDITAGDKANLREAAKNVMTAQQGNYVAMPYGWSGSINDVPFSAAPSLLEAVRYYGLLKLAIFNMQFIGMATFADTGAYSSAQDASQMALLSFNSMMAGFMRQLDAQLGSWLFTANADAFPNMTRRPELYIPPVEKLIDISQLGQFLQAIQTILPLTDDDLRAIRRKSGFLPEQPEGEAAEQVIEEEPALPSGDGDSREGGEAGEEVDDATTGDLASHMAELRARFDGAMTEFREAMGSDA